MDHQNRRNKTSILDSLGEEIVRIIVPVTICMFIVVLLVTILDDSSSSSSSINVTSIATVSYTETDTDSDWDKLKGALLTALVFVAVITVTTFVLVLLFYLRCVKFLKYYMGFSACVVLGFMGGEIAILILETFSIPIDVITFMVVLFNFTVVGVMAVFMSKMAIFVTQSYLVVIGVLVAYWFTNLPEWTTWVLLIAMSLYDLAAVLLPGGPLRLLVELAMSRDEDIPALVYEARPVTATYHDNGSGHGEAQRRRWRDRRDVGSDLADASNAAVDPSLNTGDRLVYAEEGRAVERGSELTTPLVEQQMSPPATVSIESLDLDGIGLGASGAIKLGLGDFIFYSVLVGRAAMYDYMTVYACYLAIIAGLGITLMLLALYQKALPALPFSILLGVIFYFLTRLLLENFVVQCSMNLLMF